MNHFTPIACLLVTGCAAPHRAALTYHHAVTKHYEGRKDGLISETVETWKDKEGGGGIFFLSTTDAQVLNAVHYCQPALGGSNFFNTGPITIKVDPQTGQIIQETGAAVGNIVGAALKTAVKP